MRIGVTVRLYAFTCSARAGSHWSGWKTRREGGAFIRAPRDRRGRRCRKRCAWDQTTHYVLCTPIGASMRLSTALVVLATLAAPLSAQSGATAAAAAHPD